MDDARKALKAAFGYDDFRRGQVDVVASVLAGRDTLGVLPTGGGKSLCYQVPALVLPGLTVVISPLISLMKDQVDRLDRLRVPATFLNSTLEPEEVSARLARAESGALKLLYVAPERFEAADLQRCLQRCALALLAVDEAHCISEWGHEFRPSFRRIAEVGARLRIPQTMALTATATPMVRRDIATQLRLRNPAVIVAGFDRTNLSYEVGHCREDQDKCARLLTTLRARPRPAIVYASTRADVDRVTRYVARMGVRALGYHGGLVDGQRQHVQEVFMAGGVDCLVATNAFGMGIDKPDVRLVVHFAMPGTLEAYYQEAGRAGRDGQPGHCLLLHAPDDRRTHEFFITGMFPRRDAVESAYATMRRTHLDGHVRPPRGRDGVSAVRVLREHGALEERKPARGVVRVRLLATRIRIVRECASRSPERDLLRALWRAAGENLYSGATIALDRIAGNGTRDAKAARAALETLQARQFVHVQDIGGGLFLADPRAPLEQFSIDWKRLERREASERRKLDAMEGYVRTNACRRAFVLRYFGERGTRAHCSGCDNCLRSQ